MRYTRTFKIQSSHFNGLRTYDWYWGFLDGKQPPTVLNAVLKDCHGHDFKVVVEADGDLDDGGILVDDELIEKIVRRWDRTNISTLPEYADNRLRATTERMAKDLLARLSYEYPDVTFTVYVHETDEICASANWVDDASKS